MLLCEAKMFIAVGLAPAVWFVIASEEPFALVLATHFCRSLLRAEDGRI